TAARPRPGTLPAPTNANTPRGNGVPPPTRGRCRADRRARPGPALPGTDEARRRPPTDAGADARRRSRISCWLLGRLSAHGRGLRRPAIEQRPQHHAPLLGFRPEVSAGQPAIDHERVTI